MLNMYKENDVVKVEYVSNYGDVTEGCKIIPGKGPHAGQVLDAMNKHVSWASKMDVSAYECLKTNAPLTAMMEIEQSLCGQLSAVDKNDERALFAAEKNWKKACEYVAEWKGKYE